MRKVTETGVRFWIKSDIGEVGKVLFLKKRSISVTFPGISSFGGGGNLGHYAFTISRR